MSFDKVKKNILMIFIEPTPYIIGLIATLRNMGNCNIDVIFLQNNVSQQWNLPLDTQNVILPGNIISKMRYIFFRLISGDYDLVSLTGWGNSLCIALFFLSKSLRIPLVVDSDTPLLPSVSVVRRVVKRILYPVLFKIPRMFLPAGTRQAAYLMHYNVPSSKIILEKMTVDVLGIQQYINQLPVDASISFRRRAGLGLDDFIVLFVGRLIERKGIQELLQVFENLNNPRIKLVIVGDGPLTVDVENASRWNHAVHYLGWLEKNALIDVYVMSNIFVLPAHWEPWGLVINEAMAAGKPVIASNQVGCVDDLIISGKTGLVINPGCARSLQQAIGYLYDNPVEYNNMARSCLELISEWTLEQEAKQVSLAWESALSDGNVEC